MSRRIDTCAARVRREVNGLLEATADQVVTAPPSRLEAAEQLLALVMQDIAAVRLHIAGQLQLRVALPALDPEQADIELVHEIGWMGQKRTEAFVNGVYVGVHRCGQQCTDLPDDHDEEAARALAMQHITKGAPTDDRSAD